MRVNWATPGSLYLQKEAEMKLAGKVASSSETVGQTNTAEAVIIAALVRAKAGKEEELGRRLHMLVEESRLDRGVINNDLHHSLEDPSLVVPL